MIDMRQPARARRARLFGVAGAALFAALLALSALGQGPGRRAPARPPEQAGPACLDCHASEVSGHPAVNAAAFEKSPHAPLGCQGCHSSITGAPHTPEMLKEKPTCGSCHTEQEAANKKSAHAYPDKVPGDHPTCISCHGKGDPHAVRAEKLWPRERKVAVCSSCHANRELMRRYGPDSDAVESYRESFHGKALLRFGKLDVAICSDCHGHHDVLPPYNPAARTHRNNAPKTCGQDGCHAGAMVNFAMSGANHLRLKVKTSKLLHFEEQFFGFLTMGTIGILLLGVAFDLRREVFGKEPPACGRPAGIAISLAFLCVVITLTMAYLEVPGRRWTLLAAGLCLVIAFTIYALSRKAAPREPSGGRLYQRFTVVQRAQHILLALSFTALVLTGMPLRYPDVPVLHAGYVVFGGMAVMRIVHRVAAVVMIGAWIWHTAYLVYRWWKAGFKLSSWTMFPSMKDVGDLLKTIEYYLGQSESQPKFDRFQFKEKFDYFAVYWGMPVMVFSGLVLWFPIALGNLLPEIGISAAYIAHSDEAVLAFLAILMWHFYNTHFHPEHFPMSPVWLTGSLNEEEMEREHPLELERIHRSEEKTAVAGAPSAPADGGVS